MRSLGLLVLSLFSAACEGPAGPEGPGGDPGDPGDDGLDGQVGDLGNPGEPGTPGRDSYLTGSGLVLDVTSASISSTGVVTADLTITDGAGEPLDRTGQFTEGAISASFLVAHLAVDGAGAPGQYTSYTTRVQTAPGGATATQASGESNGTWVEVGVAQGTYRYTFDTNVTVADATETHTVGVYGSRTFAGKSYGDDDTYHFVPAGGAAVAREVVTDASCNTCHAELSAHGGARKSLALCVTCHTGQTTDPDTGNTLDMRVMVHKIHSGEELPSVAAGTPYQIVGFQSTVHDYSTVVFPQPINQCDSCHQGAQADNWTTNPSAPACTGCHDDIVFSETTPLPAGKTYHTGGLASNAPCATCHAPDTSIEPIVQTHAVGKYDPAFTPEITIISVTSSGPGQRPVVAFAVTVGGAPRNILASPLQSLRATFAGPNTDYATYWQSTIQGSGGTPPVAFGDPANGVFTWTAPVAAAIPALATGSYTIGFEGYVTPAGTTDRIAAVNPLFAFAVTDATPTPRRHIVALDQCDGCHKKIEAHGGSRTNPDYCAMCHNANNTNDERAPHFEGPGEQYVYTVSLENMVHRIHMGEDLTQSYVLGGNPAPKDTNPLGFPVDFGEVRFPAPRSRCSMCHDGDSYVLPLPGTGRLPRFDEIRICEEDETDDGDAYCAPLEFTSDQTFPMAPASAACLGCHDALDTVAHTQIMTSASGAESCAVCHGPDDEHGVKKVHGL